MTFLFEQKSYILAFDSRSCKFADELIKKETREAINTIK